MDKERLAEEVSLKIYIASSWKNEVIVRDLAKILRIAGDQEVYCFAEHSEQQVQFNWPDVVDMNETDGIQALELDVSKRAFQVDFNGLGWCNCLILVNPSGRDSHFEAGYVRGKGGQVFIIGDWPKGEYSNMYHLAHKLYYWEQVAEMVRYLKELDKY